MEWIVRRLHSHKYEDIQVHVPNASSCVFLRPLTEKAPCEAILTSDRDLVVSAIFLFDTSALRSKWTFTVLELEQQCEDLCNFEP